LKNNNNKNKVRSFQVFFINQPRWKSFLATPTGC